MTIDACHGERIDIGGRRLACFHTPGDGPTVILESGLGCTADTWAQVQPGIAQFASVCSYDRAGVGQSDPAPTPRTCQDLIEDLHALVGAAKLLPPFILVGHSLGGLIVRLYAAHHADLVAGMVLVDATHEEKYMRFEAVLSESLRQRNRTYLQDPSRNAEHLDVLASVAQVRRVRRPSDVPFVALARGRQDAPSPIWPSAALQQIEVELQRELTNDFTQGTFVVAERSGHFIQHDEPAVVIRAIRDVIERARRTP